MTSLILLTPLLLARLELLKKLVLNIEVWFLIVIVLALGATEVYCSNTTKTHLTSIPRNIAVISAFFSIDATFAQAILLKCRLTFALIYCLWFIRSIVFEALYGDCSFRQYVIFFNSLILLYFLRWILNLFVAPGSLILHRPNLV